jgi:hypothetical protein
LTLALEQSVSHVEQRLVALGAALALHDTDAIDSEAAALQRALAAAVEQLGQAARAGAVPPQLRQRLAQASGRVAAQREALARATAALDRAIDVLVPSAAVAYSAGGLNERSTRSGLVQA